MWSVPIFMTWINAKTTPPPPECRVLLCDQYGWVFAGIYEMGKYHATVGDEAGCEVICWMYIPEAPN